MGIEKIAEEIGGVIAGHVNSLPKLEELVGRLEAVAKQLEPVAELVAPSASGTVAKVEAGVAEAGQVADAAIAAGEHSEQTKAEAAASVEASKVPEEGSSTEPTYTAAEWARMKEAEASTAAAKVPATEEPPAPTV